MAANRYDSVRNIDGRRIDGRSIRLAASHCYPTSELQLKQAAIELSLSALMVSDLQGYLIEINPALLRLWGYECREDILGRRLSDLVLDSRQVASLLEESSLYGSWSGELIIVRKHGTLRVVQCETKIVPDLQGRSLCLASFLDITERAEAQQLLRASEARYRNIVNAVPVGIALTNSQGAITFYSAQAQKLFGLADNQVALGTHYRDWIAQSQPTELPQLAGETISAGPLEVRLRRADGAEFWGEATVVMVDDDDAGQGEAEGGNLIVVHNISDRKLTEDALAHYAHDLERSNHELEQFAYVASHDLQEPLRMVAAYVQLLAKDYQGQFSSEGDEYIAFAVDGAKRMQRLIDDLLAYSRVGTRVQTYHSVDCNEVLCEVLNNLRFAIEERGASVTSTALPCVCGDRGQIVQLLQNLIANALKFSDTDAPAIQIRADLQPRRSQGVYPGHALWQFAVSDNGIGIEEQYYERIFVIFQRLHSRAQYSGTGIGLAICKKIIEQHGGRIWVESMPGQGSTFYFTLSGAPHQPQSS